MDTWLKLRDKIAQSQESSDDLTEECCRLSPPSPGTEVLVPESAFWVPLLLEHTQGIPRSFRDSPIHVLSACTGSFAEASVLKDC